MMSSKYEDSRNFEWIFISVAAMCALLVSAAAFVIMKRHAKYKSKFEGLIGSNTEVSKDYQVNVCLWIVAIVQCLGNTVIANAICVRIDRNCAERGCRVKKKNPTPRRRESQACRKIRTTVLPRGRAHLRGIILLLLKC